MTPAVSQPAVPPPTITTLLTGRTISRIIACRRQDRHGGSARGRMTTPGGSRTSSHTPLAHLHPEAHAQRVATSVCEHVEELIVVASVRAQRFVRDVQRLEEH